MMHTQKPWMIFVFAIALCLSGALGASADVSLSANGATWQAAKHGATLTLSGPAGHITHTFGPGETPFLAASDLTDGIYTWELTVNAQTRNRDAAAPRASAKPLFGSFTVQGGGFVDPTVLENADKAQVFTTDLIVEGSACIGVDCESSESFSFDTIRLKENNLRIKFQDTSNANGNFPSVDWELLANESNNGGANKFSILDTTNSKTIFTLEANAPSNSLYVDSDGQVGVGTSSPAMMLHVQDGDGPALRLHQDGSSGFQTQIWDIFGNEAGLFVRDITNGSGLPVKIDPGAPNYTLSVDSNGRVGVNKQNPSYALDVSGDAQISGSVIGDTTISGGSVKLNLEDTTNSTTWFLQSDSASDTLLISKSGSGGGEIRIDDREDSGSTGVTFFVDGSIQADNVSITSSRSAKADFESVDPQDVLTRLNSVDIQTWRYKTEDESIRHMGPIAEDFAAAFELGKSETEVTVTDFDGVALAAIQALSQKIEELQNRIDELENP